MGNINQIYVQKSHKTNTYSRLTDHGNNKHDYIRQCMGNTVIKAEKKLCSPPPNLSELLILDISSASRQTGTGSLK